MGKTRVIINYSSPKEIVVLMDKPRRCSDCAGNKRIDWVVEASQIEPVIRVGQQLMFNFMQQS